MIRALSVIGHGTNLLKHYIEHYQRYVDEINLVVYESDLYRELVNEVNQIIDEYPNVKIVKTVYDRIFDWEKVTQLYNYVKREHPNDWWVIADIDELHLYPEDDLRQLIIDCETNNWDIVRGGFIDRIGPDGPLTHVQIKFVLLKDMLKSPTVNTTQKYLTTLLGDGKDGIIR
jgi:hypothetical protein